MDAETRRRRLFDYLRSIVATALPRGAVVLSALTLCGYAMGLLRDKMLTHVYGAGSELDAYNAAFVLPELALDVLVAGGLVAPFVPIFLGLKGEAEEDARAFGRTVLTLSVLVMAVAAGVLFVLAPQTADLIVPAYRDEQRDLYINLFRAMLVTPVIFAASLVVGEILVAERRFFTYGMAALMYSGGIAAGAFFLGDESAFGIYGAAVGAVVGAFLHLGIRLVGVYRTRFRPRPTLRLKTRGLGEFLRLMAPKMVSQPIEPITYLYFTRLASSLAVGSVTAYNLGRNFQGMPVQIFGMAFAIAAFPPLSAAMLAGDRRRFLRVFATNLVTILVLSTGCAVGMFVFGEWGIRFLFGSGAFTDEDVRQTALVLTIFTVSIPLEAVNHLLARALYATKNTVLPTIATVAGFIVTVVAAEALAPRFALAAIPAAYSIGMAARVVLLAAVLALRLSMLKRAGETATELSAASTDDGRRRAPSLRRRQVALGVISILLIFGLVYSASQALNGATLAAQPVTTPWARERATAALPTAAGTPSIASPSTPGWIGPGATVVIGPTFRKPQPFGMDLYEKGDYVGEFTDKWCVPAAMQVSMNIMDAGADTTRPTQQRLFDLAVSLAGERYGGAEVEGWAMGLEKLGYGNYAVGAKKVMMDAVKLVVKQIRLTNRPAGLITWKGWHSWVVSGFQATDDPAYTDDFEVKALYIEDVWYNRRSTIWSKSRGGYSRPPDSLVPVGELGEDFLPWHQAHYYAGKEGMYVYVFPVA